MLVSGVFYDAAGPLASITVRFVAEQTTLNGVLRASNAEFTTQEDGSYALELEPGYYRVSWVSASGAVTVLGSIVADESSTLTLPQALEASPTPVTPSEAQDYLTQITQQADRAESEADAAEQSANTATNAADALTNFGVDGLVVLTQAEYDALASPDPETLYVITGA